jgi:predicted  nucleic acid-binding Zn-ribbon protein
MSDTPKTNAAKFWSDIGGWVTPASKFMELERELNRSNEMFRKLNIHSLDLTDRIRRLEELVEIGGRMADIGQKIVHQGGEDMYWIRKLEEELTEWTTAKEAKL